MGWTIGVDVGGTFTDFFASCDETGAFHVGKTPSTPANPAQAILTGLVALCEQFEIPLDKIGRLSHGTTVGTNALIQRTGSPVALITTKGFRDLLEIGRQTRPHMYDLQKDHPAPLVEREHRIELAERIGAAGEIVNTPGEDDIVSAVEAVVASGAEACAVGFLFAFRNPVHEQRVADVLRERAPDLAISISSEVQPEFREYERLSTTVLNAYLQPVLGEYLQTLEKGVADSAPMATLGINQSSGGLMSPRRAREFPVRTALSGPAAGAVGAAHAARQTGRRNVITLDMGGTSADVALIRDYKVDLSFDRDVAGFPIRMPCVDVETVGAGGGSIAWFDRDGLLKAGPISAGADPGPACYGRGGNRPTVTDANLLLGRLSSRGLLDGDMGLDRSLSSAAYQPLADKLGFTVEKTAHGVLGIVVANMVRTIRTISVERGHDPRDFVLMPFGGAGPLHARDVAVSLGIGELLVPAAPGIVCAQGLLVSDLKEDFVVSKRFRLDDAGLGQLREALDGLQKSAVEWFDAEKAPEDGRRLDLVVDARYVGQNFELAVPVAGARTLSAQALPDLEQMTARFSAAHETAYGYASADDPIEIVNVRLSASARLHNQEDRPNPTETPSAPQVRDRREVYFDADSPIEANVYSRADLVPGQSLTGPAIIEQLDTTTPLYTGDRAVVTADGHLIIAINADAGDGS
ncbi:MAG: hydantoinase/oxoprolinase family protein [Alphaproteobacteria bacterium]|nr:hydantoinase/oxoprolinase family protein [Alphaproteobacteria bacterium]